MKQRPYQLIKLGEVIKKVPVRTSSNSASNGGSPYYVILEDIKNVFENVLLLELNGDPIPLLLDSDDNRIVPWRIAYYPGETLDVITQIDHNSSLDPPLNQEIKQKQLEHTMIQEYTKAVLAQNFELYEHPTPRLFIILPVDKSNWNATHVLENKVRLHFLCECGDHTMKENESSQDQIHLAGSEGYEIRDATEFFCKYGEYMHILMQGLRGMQSVDISVPHIPIPQLLSAGIDYSISYMEALSAVIPFLSNNNTVDGYEVFESANLRQLDTFLQINDEHRKYGNLYRTTTETGLVKWVCSDHFKSTYKQNVQKAFEDAVDGNGGKYDSQLGQVVVKLGCRILAQEFYDALVKARHVYDLDITLDWGFSRADLEMLEKALKMSTVSILRLDLQQFQTSFINKLFSSSAQYEILVRIIEHHTMKNIHVILSGDFANLSNIQPKISSHLHKLSLEIWSRTIGPSDFRVLVDSLKTNTTLTALNLWHCSIGNEGALALSEALKINTTLTTLDLSGNLIEDEGALALSKALKTNTTLTALNLQDNQIKEQGALALLEALKNNTTLTTLYLENNSIRNKGIQAALELKADDTLTTLTLWDKKIGHQGVLALSYAIMTNSTLISLDLTCNSIKNEGALALSEALKTNTTLTTLDLMWNSIGYEGALALSEVLKSNTTLTTLSLKENSVGNEGALALSGALKTNITLTTLDLGRNSIGLEGAVALSEALKTNTALTILDLWDNQIGYEGTLALSVALTTNAALTSLNLASNSIGEEGAMAMSEVLKTNTTLTTLDMKRNKIEKHGALALSEALKTNSTLTTLRLQETSIGNEGALALSKMLKTNTTLTALNLGGNKIEREGFLALSEALEINTTLSTLDMSHNSIGDEGALALSKVLKTNTTLTTLNVWSNSIGDEGVQALSEVLKTSTAEVIY